MEIVYITLLTVISGGIGTMTGFGTSTIMVPILVLYYPLPQTLLLVGIIHWFSDLWKLLLFKQGIRWKLILAFGLPGIAATYFGALVVFSVPNTLLSQILGILLIAYVFLLLIKPAFKLQREYSTAIIGGVSSGFLAGIFGVGGAVRGMFLSAFDLPKTIYIATAGAIAIVIDSTRLITYSSKGVWLDDKLLFGLFFFIPASLLGAHLAKYIVGKIPQSRFRAMVAVFLFLVGVKLLAFP